MNNTFTMIEFKVEDPYPSLSDYHDYEPGLEFDDAELFEKKPEDDVQGILLNFSSKITKRLPYFLGF